MIPIGLVLARATLFFGPAEYFWIAMFVMALISVVVGSNAVTGLMAAALGLLPDTVGLHQLSGAPRYTFDEVWPLSAVDLIIILVSLYALPPDRHRRECRPQDPVRH